MTLNLTLTAGKLVFRKTHSRTLTLTLNLIITLSLAVTLTLILVASYLTQNITVCILQGTSSRTPLHITLTPFVCWRTHTL